MSFYETYRHPALCQMLTRAGTRCSNTGGETFGEMDVCGQHKDQLTRNATREIRTPDGRWLLKQMREAIDEFDAERIAETRRLAEEREAALQATAIVYYVERDGFIKIGMTTQLGKRLASLANGGTKTPVGMTIGPVTLLATHGGGLVAERAMHARFRQDRVIGEWFTKSPELMAHIAAVLARRERQSA